jgi:hypothetical protein
MTQIGISLPDSTWRTWTLSHSPQLVAACTFALFAIRLTSDLALCLWAVGPDRREHAWSSVKSWFQRSNKTETA